MGIRGLNFQIELSKLLYFRMLRESDKEMNYLESVLKLLNIGMELYEEFS